MTLRSPSRLILCFLPLAIALPCLIACSGGIDFSQDPAQTVTIEIEGITSDAQRDAVKEKLKGMTDGSGHSMTTISTGDQMTVQLSPVTNVEAFSEKIDFGEVTKVEGRTVTVKFQP